MMRLRRHLLHPSRYSIHLGLLRSRHRLLVRLAPIIPLCLLVQQLVSRVKAATLPTLVS